LEKSDLVKTVEIWEIVNAYEIGDRCLQSFLSQSFFREFSAKEFFNSHSRLHSVTCREGDNRLLNYEKEGN